jgi:anti-sigma factor (TIGR02949 family)
MMEQGKKHDHKNCHQLLGSLSEYVDGELDDELCSVLEHHLEDCENCRIVVDTLRKTVYLYRTTGREEPMPTDIRERLFKKLDIQDYLENKSV